MIAARVIVVEDEPVVALHLKQQLTRLGYVVPAMATSGEKALGHINALRPDVVLMDIHIEGSMDGIETAAAIPADLQIPVVYLTAYSEEPTIERARQTTSYSYLRKPFSERELHATLQMVLERRRADAAQRENELRLEALVTARTAALEEEARLRLEAEHEGHELQKMETLGRLTGGVAHDFNNFLSVMMGNLDRIQRRPALSREDLQRTVAMALRAAKGAATLTARLLAFSRRQPLDPKPLSINHLILTLSEMLHRTLGEGVVIQTAFTDDLWWTRADAHQLESALLNVALNARDAMPGGGALTIETSNVVLDGSYCARERDVVPGEYARIIIRDSGRGMATAVVHRAFEPFFTTKQGGQGAGLGLSQVYGFFKQSRGHATIHSELGEGTTVQLFLPRLTGEQGAAASPIATLKSTAEEIILVVEDDNDVRSNTVSNLRDLGYQVVHAGEGESALRMLEANPGIRLLFTDVGLPGLNGREVADQAHRIRPDIRVVFTSGYAHDALVHQGLLDPGVQLLPKPFSFSDLAVKIRHALDSAA